MIYDWTRGKKVNVIALDKTALGYQTVLVSFTDGTSIMFEQIGQDDRDLLVTERQEKRR